MGSYYEESDQYVGIYHKEEEKNKGSLGGREGMKCISHSAARNTRVYPKVSGLSR
jgi:hypothetical protein